MRRRISGLLVFATVATAWGAVPASAQVGSTTVVISEFRARGPVGGNDEFVELRNMLRRARRDRRLGAAGLPPGTPGTPSNRATVPAGVTLAPGQTYLFTNNNASGGYSGHRGGRPDVRDRDHRLRREQLRGSAHRRRRRAP